VRTLSGPPIGTRKKFHNSWRYFPTPNDGECFEVLRFESLQIDPETRLVPVNMNDPNQLELYRRYNVLSGWLRGFFTAINLFGVMSDRDVTKNSKEKEWMPWIYSYCRSHPRGNVVQAALELAKALSSKNP
jgi:hypothetical protein